MRGPELSTLELLTYLTHRVERFERLGLSHDAAIHAVALDDRLDEQKVRVLISSSDPESALMSSEGQRI
jgi:hypothetical protein